jgi:ApaG protein
MNALFPYMAETGGITIRVAPRYLPEQSDVLHRRFAWSYHVRIENHRSQAVQLLRRHWIITNADGVVEEVEGPGVIGQTPVIEPGATFDYISGCPLGTPSGTMRGSFTMRQIVDEPGRGEFAATIPRFVLDSPHAPVKH